MVQVFFRFSYLSPYLLKEGRYEQAKAYFVLSLKDMLSTKDITVIVVVSCAQLFAQAGFAESVLPSHIIGDHFGTQDAGQLSWTTAAYSLTFGTFM